MTYYKLEADAHTSLCSMLQDKNRV